MTKERSVMKQNMRACAGAKEHMEKKGGKIMKKGENGESMSMKKMKLSADRRRYVG